MVKQLLRIREAFGVRRSPSLLCGIAAAKKAKETFALQTLRELNNVLCSSYGIISDCFANQTTCSWGSKRFASAKTRKRPSVNCVVSDFTAL